MNSLTSPAILFEAALHNAVLTPHCAGITPETLEAGLRMAVENIWRFAEGRPEHVVG